jgi:hypothetical protein
MASRVRLVYAFLNRLKTWREAVGRLRGRNDNGLSVRGLSLRLYHAKIWDAVNSETFPTAHEWLRWHLREVLGSHLIDF